MVDSPEARKLWVLSPSKGDAESFAGLRERILLELRALGHFECRFVLLDAQLNSQELSSDPAMTALSLHDDVGVVAVPESVWRRGPGHAVVFGLREIMSLGESGDWIVTLDADGEDPPEGIAHLISVLSEKEGTEMGAMTVAVATGVPRSRLFDWCFWILVGRVPRNRHFAAFSFKGLRVWGRHPFFGVSYAGALLNAPPQVVEVPCPRGMRLRGKSRVGVLTRMRESRHMIIPFHARVSARLIRFSRILGLLGLLALFVSLELAAFTWGVAFASWLAVAFFDRWVRGFLAT
jgi:hypothetical protein